MRKSLFAPQFLVLVVMCLGLDHNGLAQNATQLQVARAAICKEVVDLEPVDSGTSFLAAEGRLYCFTNIKGAQSPTQVTHVWLYDGTETARVNLAVNSARWRTYSSKTIRPDELGAWHVDVLDSMGNVLKRLEFEVTP